MEARFCAFLPRTDVGNCLCRTDRGFTPESWSHSLALDLNTNFLDVQLDSITVQAEMSGTRWFAVDLNTCVLDIHINSNTIQAEMAFALQRALTAASRLFQSHSRLNPQCAQSIGFG